MQISVVILLEKWENNTYKILEIVFKVFLWLWGGRSLCFKDPPPRSATAFTYSLYIFVGMPQIHSSRMVLKNIIQYRTVSGLCIFCLKPMKSVWFYKFSWVTASKIFQSLMHLSLYVFFQLHLCKEWLLKDGSYGYLLLLIYLHVPLIIIILGDNEHVVLELCSYLTIPNATYMSFLQH